MPVGQQILEYLVKEWHVISEAPVIFLTGLSLSALVTWKVCQAFYRRHVDVLSAQRDHFRALAESSRPPAENASRKRKIMDGLAELIRAGHEMRPRAANPYRVPLSREQKEKFGAEADAWVNEWNAWMSRVQGFLGARMGPQAVTKFNHTAGVQPSESQFAYPYPLLDRQIQNLVDIMERIDAYL